MITGNFEHIISTDTEFGKYKYMVIWRVDFSVSFLHAELK